MKQKRNDRYIGSMVTTLHDDAKLRATRRRVLNLQAAMTRLVLSRIVENL
jgi:hypothetical protein